MKLKHLAGLSLVVGTAFSTSAMATDPTVNFKGRVVSTACVPTIDGKANATVELPPIVASAFPVIGNTAGETTFTINLVGCVGKVGSIARTYFWQVGATNGRLVKNDGTGTGWTYQLLPETGTTPLTVGTSATPFNASDPGKLIGVSPTASINYRVRYYREVAGIISGTLNAKANYVVYTD